jgi:hypothetical protein
MLQKSLLSAAILHLLLATLTSSLPLLATEPEAASSPYYPISDEDRFYLAAKLKAWLRSEAEENALQGEAAAYSEQDEDEGAERKQALVTFIQRTLRYVGQ